MPDNLPLTVDDLTTEWLQEKLGSVLGDARICSFESQIVGADEGFMGQLARVTLTTEGGGDNTLKSVIAKFAATSEKIRDLASEMQYYQREIGFYRDIGHDVGVPVASSYYFEHAQSTNHFVILMEDLAPIPVSDQLVGTDPATSRAVIESMATLHAKWWNSERLAEYAWAQPIVNAKPIAESRDMLDESIAAAEKSGRFDDYPEFKRLVPMLPPLLKMEAPPPFPYTLCHGDLRSDNVFYDSDGIKLIDWQLAGMASPMNDIARFLSQSITVEQRRETEQDLLQVYYDKLIELGVTGYTYKQMQQEYKLNLVVLLLMFSMSMDHLDATGRKEDVLHVMYERLDAAVLDWKIVDILKVLPLMIPFLKFSTWLKMKFKK